MFEEPLPKAELNPPFAQLDLSELDAAVDEVGATLSLSAPGTEARFILSVNANACAELLNIPSENSTVLPKFASHSYLQEV